MDDGGMNGDDGGGRKGRHRQKSYLVIIDDDDLCPQSFLELTRDLPTTTTEPDLTARS
jgi:hypothetical protein